VTLRLDLGRPREAVGHVALLMAPMLSRAGDAEAEVEATRQSAPEPKPKKDG
jgi:hypothetical protein